MGTKELKRMGFNDTFTFGKYRGKTVREVFKLDISYLEWWIAENNLFFTKEVKDEVRLRALGKDADIG